ncbi:MAG: methyltransferase domain-containing protein [Planctomycetaceae bacterium]
MEISPMAAEGADERIQLRFAPTLKAADYAEGMFDQVVIWHVLEHLLYPRETIQEAARILKPGAGWWSLFQTIQVCQSRWSQKPGSISIFPGISFIFRLQGYVNYWKRMDSSASPSIISLSA